MVGFSKKMHKILREQQRCGVIGEYGTFGELEVSPHDGSKRERCNMLTRRLPHYKNFKEEKNVAKFTLSKVLLEPTFTYHYIRVSYY